jgi:hypothetical protein
MMKLLCSLVGNAFPVTIDASDLVGDLKKSIKKEKENDLKAIDADKIQLFLAKKDDEWLTQKQVEEGISETSDFESLDVAGAPLNLVGLSEEDVRFEVTKEDIKSKNIPVHVLVVVPNQKCTASEMSVAPIPLTAEQTKMIVNEVLNERDEKASAYSFSNLNTAMEERILKKMRLTENVPTDIHEPEDTSIPGYSWIPEVLENGQSQRAGYMAYLQQHLATLLNGGNFVLADIANDKEVLTIEDPRLPFRMNGTADVLLIKGRRVNPLITLAGVCMVIELKKKVEKAHVPQAVGQLVSCSIKAPLNCYPLSLLTDLNDHWHFSWFSDKHVLTQVTLQYPKNAFEFIMAAVGNRSDSPPLAPSFIPVPLKTIKVDDFLPQPVDASAEEMMERYELMADMVEPEFLMARRMEYAQRMVQSMPMYAHMYT